MSVSVCLCVQVRGIDRPKQVSERDLIVAVLCDNMRIILCCMYVRRRTSKVVVSEGIIHSKQLMFERGFIQWPQVESNVMLASALETCSTSPSFRNELCLSFRTLTITHFILSHMLTARRGAACKC